MGACKSCGEQIPAAQRWCPMCHANARNPSLGRLASPAKRFAAFALDVTIPVVALFVIVGAGAGAGGDDAGAVFSMIVMLAIAYGIGALVLFSRGTTPGKRLLGMWVVKESGQRAGFGTMFFREWIGKWISGFIFGLGYLWILIDDDRQGWHDRFASTYVVTRRAAKGSVAARPA